jgi:hypothetical protein
MVVGVVSNAVTISNYSFKDSRFFFMFCQCKKVAQAPCFLVINTQSVISGVGPSSKVINFFSVLGMSQTYPENSFYK